jgi:hypothetical protein
MPDRMRSLLPEITGSTVSMAGPIAVTMADVEMWLRVSGYVVGLIAGLLTIWSLVKKRQG